MRFLLFAALLVLTVLLVAHGLFFADQAQKLYDQAAASPNPDFSQLVTEYPYSDAARTAVLGTITRRAAHETQGALPNIDKLKLMGNTLLDDARAGLSPKPPYVMPFTAALVGIAGLALALLMPATRFRGMALLGFLFGAGAAIPGMLPSDDQAALVAKLDFTKHLIAELPRIAQGCCLLAGLVLAGRVRRRREGESE